ncbi:MAG: sugar transferase [Deltaproteobacteria bacterium]|nr:sugar transferase [Deltaproteobacteria bacterium]
MRGITGLWQVSGRNDTEYDNRVQLDKEYSARQSIGFDAWIILKTIPVILFRKGAY